VASAQEAWAAADPEVSAVAGQAELVAQGCHQRVDRVADPVQVAVGQLAAQAAEERAVQADLAQEQVAAQRRPVL